MSRDRRQLHQNRKSFAGQSRGGKKLEEAKEQWKHSFMLNLFRALWFYFLKALL